MREKWLVDAEKKIQNMPEEAKTIRHMAMDDLVFFASLVNPGYMYGDIHKECYKWMQEYSLYGIGTIEVSSKLLMLPRGHLKSHMVATWAAWIITRHPEVTMLYLSATASLSETQLYAIKNILLSDQFQRYFPEYINPQEGKRAQWTNSAITIDHPKRKKEAIRDATVEAAGLTTTTTGWHADVIVADDLVVPENAYTADGRESVAKKSSQFSSIQNPGGFTLACGTRYHPKDVYAEWKEMEYEDYDDEGNLIGVNKVWGIKEHCVETDGIFLWPKMIRPSDQKAFGYDRRELAKIKSKYLDKTQFFSQYYNDPNEASSNRIDASKFQYYDRRHLNQQSGYWYYKDRRLNVYAAIDFAYALSKASDFTVICVIGIDSDANIYILDIDRFKTDKISEYFKHILELHSKWEFRKLRAETTAAQSIIVRDLKDKVKQEGMVLSIDEFRPSRKEGTKEERIAAALEHRYENLQMWHFKGGYTDILEEELVLARPPHDDCKDSLASVVEIAIKPKAEGRTNSARDTARMFNSRFGGLAFK